MYKELGVVKGDRGFNFGVWAPHANGVSVIGDFNDWNPDVHPMRREADFWYATIENAQYGQEYRFHIVNGDQKFTRIDPYAFEVTNSVGNGILSDPGFDWGDSEPVMIPRNRLVIYEMHIGTFNRPEGKEVGTFDDAIDALDHLEKLGVNCIEIMPCCEFAGDISWGYNPAHPFAIEQAYGGPLALKRFVKACHDRRICVIIDVVYNHFGPSDLSLWQFDGWSENNKGGIYFYNDWRSTTPWGDTRPDYGREEVRQYILDNARYFLSEFQADGLRLDMTLFIRHVRGDADPGAEIPEGWSLTQAINRMVREEFPGKITIAEDLQNNDWITKAVEHGGAGFSMQWDANFVHPVRAIAIAANDESRNMDQLAQAITWSYNGDPFQRVTYSESHDEVANGKARVPFEIDDQDPDGYFARKRSMLAFGMAILSPGVPMIFQGQEFLEDGWFQDTVELDWEKSEKFPGVGRFYRDLVRLRCHPSEALPELCAPHIQILRTHNKDCECVFRRWDNESGAESIIVVNFSHAVHDHVEIPLTSSGRWHCIFNSDNKRYGRDFDHVDEFKPFVAESDGAKTSMRLGPYSIAILRLERVPTASEERSDDAVEVGQ